MTPGPELTALLVAARKLGASDLLLVAGSPPSVYVHGALAPMKADPLRVDDLRLLITQMMDEARTAQFDRDRDLDFSLAHPDFGRCRVNVHYQRNTPAVAIRFVQDEIPDFTTLGLPEVVREFAHYPRGLVLITGGTGHGKSTTLAALIKEINTTTAAHIITLEDPIEYAFRSARSIVEQREIGADSPSFASALRHVVRQKPDVVMIGEMRDLETIRTAITAAETGHLVLASLHTINAAQTIERIVDVFEPQHQAQIRVQLAGALKAICCQALFPVSNGAGVVPAVEVLVSTPAIARAIREGDTHLIHGMIETGAAQGMQTLDAAIVELVRSGRIKREAALSRAADPERVERMLGRGRPEHAVAAAGARPWE